MSMGKLIRLTIQVDVEPENANLREAFEYLKRLKGAEQVELVDIAVVKDPKAEEKKQRRSLDQSFGSDEESNVDSAAIPPLRIPAEPEPEEEHQELKRTEQAQKLLDRIKIR
ncbi:MAG: hypothetical protein EHM23_13350 [Acidobacteria bacterium]|nr:MAG: hypothetical protein EHM23_13350 [Acidobacteriota bacterium]